ncbi:hypothetical protein SLE2022_048450 [Rubroshorea leprosula]
MGSTKAEKFGAIKSYKKKHLLCNLVLHFLAAITCSLLCTSPYWFTSLCYSVNHFFLISLPYIWSSFSNPKFLFVVVNVIVIFLVGESKMVSTSSSPADEIYDEYVKRTQSLRRVTSACAKMKDEKVEEKKEVMIKPVNKVEDKEVEKEKESRENFEIVEEDEEKEGDHGEEKESQEKVEIVEEDGEKEGGHGEEEQNREKVEIAEEDEDKEGDGEEEPGLPPAIVRGEDEEENGGGGEEEGGLPAEELNKRVEEFIARVNKRRWLEANSLVLYCET